MTSRYDQWIRKISLLAVKTDYVGSDAGVLSRDMGLDLSEFRIRFHISGADVESPNSAVIRVYNLAAKTLIALREHDRIILSAGYESGNFGIVFRGSIKQFKIGRENATDSYLDIYASDGDVFYNQAVLNASYSAGTTDLQILEAIGKLSENGLDTGSLTATAQATPSIRGTVLFGMARQALRNITTYLDAGWSIQDGKLVITDNTGYRDGEAVEINAATGLVGIPEQTDTGIKVSCLLNSKIRIGGRVKLNNAEITQLIQQDQNAAPVIYNKYKGLYRLAPLSADGMYRVFSIEHDGDTRGQNWHTTLICLAVNESVPANQSVSGQ